MYERPILRLLLKRCREPRRFVQVLAGPRQVGKKTLAAQLTRVATIPVVQASADGPLLEDASWLQAQWQRGRTRAREGKGRGAMLILDEVQKIRGWSETVKQCWDEDTASATPLRVWLLGSSPLLLERGLTESLAGRFEVIRVPHWSYAEMRAAFEFSLEEYLWFGGYPGAAALISEPQRWARYVLDSLIETTVSRDVLLMQPVTKPHLLRRLFQLGCSFSGQVLSYNKMLGTRSVPLDAGMVAMFYASTWRRSSFRIGRSC